MIENTSCGWNLKSEEDQLGDLQTDTDAPSLYDFSLWILEDERVFLEVFDPSVVTIGRKYVWDGMNTILEFIHR